MARSLAQLNSEHLSVLCVGRPQLNLLDRHSIEAVMERYEPDVVVNPAAFTGVDAAESNSDLAFSVNRDGAGSVAAAAASVGIPIIHISTDYVFGGNKAGAYVETDEADPQSVYGASKLAGEQAVATANADHVILRTAWVYAPWGQNFARTMLRLAGDRPVVRVVADQQGTPTYAPDIAEAIAVVAETISRGGVDEWRGIFHLTNSGSTSWAGFAAEIFKRSRESGGPWAEVQPISSADYPTPAKRPSNSKLDTTRFSRVFKLSLPDWEDGVLRFNDALQEQEKT